MRRRFSSLFVILAIILSTFSVFGAEESVREYFEDFNDGSFENVLAIRGSVAVINQEIYQGANVTMEEKDSSDKYLKLDSSKTGTPSFIYRFPETMKGKVVVEADIRMDNLTPTRNLFEVINKDQNPVVRLDGYHYYYLLGYENVSLEINEIPINNEWHHYMAVIDTEKDTFMLYINGRPVMAKEAGVYRENSAKDGVWGFRTAITYRNMVNFTKGETDVDNIRVYTLDRDEYTQITSDKYEFDYEYLTVDGAYKGITVGEFLSELKTDAQTQVYDSNARVRKSDEYIGLKDLLVVTKGIKRSFYSIRLNENDYTALMRANSPEIFLNKKRSQYFEDDSSVKPYLKDNIFYVPVRALEKIFNAQVLYNGDENTVSVIKDDIRISVYKDCMHENINGRLYVNISEFADLFGYNTFSDGELFVVDKKEKSFRSVSQIEYLKNTFTFYDDENKTVIDDFSTLEEALEKAKKMWNDGFRNDIVIDLSDKEYFLNETFEIDGEALGNKNNRLVFRGNTDKHAKISGGIELDKTKFQKITDTQIKKRLPEVSADNILMYDLSKEGITDIGTITSQGHTFEIKPSQLQLYSGKETQTLARFPNDKYLYSGRVFNMGYGWSSSGIGDNEFEYIEDRISSWGASDDIWAFGYWNDEFSPGNARISKIDKIKKSITLDGIIRAGIQKTQRPYYCYNILEELDVPGEYYIDKKTNILYYYPKDNFSDETLYVSYTDDILVKLDKCKNVIFENVDFTYTRDMGAKVFWGENVLFNKCNFIGMGTYGIIFRESSNCGAYACYFYETGAHSIMLEGGDTITLTGGNNFVISSKFEETGYRRKTYSGSVLLRGVGGYVYKNRIQNNYHMGVYVFGSLHQMKNNSFYNICYESGDAGGIYMYARWSTSLTTVEGNYYEHMRGTPEVYAPSNTAIYYDNSTSFTKTYGNIFYDVMYGVFSNCGRENEIQGNIFSDNVNNAGTLAQNTQLAIYETIHTIPWKGKIWKRENPRLYQMQFNYNPTKATDTFASNNVLDNTAEFTNADPVVMKTYDNIAYKSDKNAFMDKANRDFRLKELSAFKNTYINGTVDLKNIGPSKDMKSYTDNSLYRLYISTDISDSSYANVFVPLNEKMSIHINAKSREDDYVDLSKAVIVYDSSDENIVSVSKNGTLCAKNTGKATVSATVTLNGITKKIALNVYTDKFMWDSESGITKAEVKLSVNSKPVDLKNKCISEKGTLYIPASEVLGNLDYKYEKSGDTYRFDYYGQKLDITLGNKKVKFNNNEIEAEREPYEQNGELYIPFTLLDRLNLVTIYRESEAMGEIYRLNNATGEKETLIPQNATIVDLSELLKKDEEGWTNDKTALFTKTDDGIKFGEDTQSGKLGVFAYEKEKFDMNTMFKFKYKLNTNAYASIMLASQQAYSVPWRVSDVDSYFIVIKNDVIEVQKRVNNSQCYILDSVVNTHITFDKWHDVSLGAFEEDGKVRIIINSDGKNIIDVYDSINYSLSGTTRNIMSPSLLPHNKSGYIAFGVFTSNNSPNCYVALK